MKCGVAVGFINIADIERCAAEDWSRPAAVPDYQVWDEGLALGDLVEPLGFDALWSSEHHSSPYGMCPNTLMHLAYWAGRTERIALGTHVVVLPWHHPVQVAHEIAMLDIMMKGRPYTLGVGRGLSPKEFRALGIPQDEARQRFKESIDVIRLGLTQERFSYDGEIFKVPETSIRPRPRHSDLMDRAVAAFMTSSSLEVIARSGLGHIVVAGQSYEEIGQNTVLFNQVREEEGMPPDAQPTVYLWAYCVEKESDVKNALGPLSQLAGASSYHYGFDDPSTFAQLNGYEQYAQIIGENNHAAEAVGPTGAKTAIGPHLIGTPEQILEKVKDLQAQTGARELIVIFNFAGCLAFPEAERSMRLFAKEVLPVVHDLPTPALQLVAAQ
jgi:alkanesulfonate monooxygenase SsuD/methylene tetrahydromethanopterin reductase-like flavin-dependent oxidoreductase (luciferase family)